MTRNTASRTEVLRRVRNALGTTAGSTPDPTTIARDYLPAHARRTPEQTTELLADNLTDYRAHVHRTTPDALPGTIARLLTRHSTRRAVIPPALPQEWLTEATGVDIVSILEAATPRDLETIDTAITACALAIAETGTIVLDASPDQGPRRITLVPDHHICIVRSPTQIVDSLPQAIPRINPTRPLTWISGPSATSDIELDRVEGVHGPRTLDVIIVAD